MAYDLFVSYSRKDNERGRVSDLVARIQDDYRKFAGEDLRCFFDLSEIHAMDDWRHRILGGLRESNLLLVVLSPAYLASPYCEWEVVEFLKYEHSRAIQGDGAVQVYFVEIPGLDSPGFDEHSAAWVTRLRRGHDVDLRPWYNEGAESLKRADVRTRLDDLNRSLAQRLSRLRRIVNAPGNLPAHNPRFVGRQDEMERLHKAAGLGLYGVLTAVHGVGGMGKTALAIQYAYAYGDFYPGGRWMIGCARRTSLASAVRSLDSDLGIEFSDEEKLDDTRAAKRVLAVLQRRAEQGAAQRAGEWGKGDRSNLPERPEGCFAQIGPVPFSRPPSPRALLILDNVDDPALLRAPQTDLLSGRNWLHMMATTRLDPEQIGIDAQQHCHVPIDELPEDDALRLIESRQPNGTFADEAERDAARTIVRLLGGFTLAVEVASVFLGERQGRVTCAALLERLRREGVDEVARDTRGALAHAEKLLSATLAPTMETLTAPELRALATASLLPPDSVPLPWVRAVVAEAHPELAKDAEPGYDDPWLTLVNHLTGLRLLQVIEWAPDGRTPRICRIHRLVQAIAKGRALGNVPAIETLLKNVVTARASFLDAQWMDWECRWEIQPLSTLAAHWLDSGSTDGPRFADLAAGLLIRLGNFAGAEPLFRRSLEARERVLGPEDPITLSSVHNLGSLLENQADYAGAELLLRRAVDGYERVLGPEHHKTLSAVNSLGALLQNRGDYAGAEPLHRRVMRASERVLGPEHRLTLRAVSDLACLLFRKHDYVGAEPLYRRALDGRERVLGPDHPETLETVSNLAVLLQDRGDYAGAELLVRRAMEGYERVFGPEHPRTLSVVNNLAVALQNQGDYTGAEPLHRRVMKASERALGPEHPDTLKTVNDLAYLLSRKGDCAGAESLVRRALEGREQVLGPRHPDTLRSVADLASVLWIRGDYAGAEPLFRRAVVGFLAISRSMGREHPHLSVCRGRYALCLRKLGLKTIEILARTRAVMEEQP